MSDHTPGPWRWGFWKWDKESREYEFRPTGERVDRLDCAPVLVTCEYGCRIGEDHPESGPPEIIHAICRGQDGVGEVSISAADMALVAAAPKLLAACVRARNTLNEAGSNAIMRAVANCLDVEIKEAQMEAT